jgi:hypothetical protein
MCALCAHDAALHANSVAQRKARVCELAFAPDMKMTENLMGWEGKKVGTRIAYAKTHGDFLFQS